jgi:hypothetical protein
VASVFFSYSHADEALRDQLEKQLSLLKRQGVIQVWHDRRIGAGGNFANEIDHHVETDDIFLLLVSADFLASDYCYDKEMKRAMERHEAGEAIVIPVILRACDWHGAPFGKLNASPSDGKPVTQYPDRDQALLEVAKAVRAAAERVAGKSTVRPRLAAAQRSAVASPATTAGPRSSNLRVTDLTDIVKQMARIDAVPEEQYSEIEKCLAQLNYIATKRHILVHRTSSVFDGKLMVSNILTSKITSTAETEVIEIELLSAMQSDCARIYILDLVMSLSRENLRPSKLSYFPQ